MPAKIEVRLGSKDSRLAAGTFVEALQAFLVLLAEVEEAVAGKTTRGTVWTVADLSHRSPATVVLEATVVRPLTYDAEEVARSVVSGLRILGEEARRPPLFSDKAIHYASLLASMTTRGVDEMLVRADRESACISEDLIPHIRMLLGTPLEELGTIEGQLKMVSIAGRPRFSVYDSVTGLAVECIFDEANVKKFAAALGSRVSVSGRVIYTSDGYPRHIRDITSFFVFPDDSELPTLADVLNAGTEGASKTASGDKTL